MGNLSFQIFEHASSPKSGTFICISLHTKNLSKKMVFGRPPGVLIMERKFSGGSIIANNAFLKAKVLLGSVCISQGGQGLFIVRGSW